MKGFQVRHLQPPEYEPVIARPNYNTSQQTQDEWDGDQRGSALPLTGIFEQKRGANCRPTC